MKNKKKIQKRDFFKKNRGIKSKHWFFPKKKKKIERPLARMIKEKKKRRLKKLKSEMKTGALLLTLQTLKE